MSKYLTTHNVPGILCCFSKYIEAENIADDNIKCVFVDQNCIFIGMLLEFVPVDLVLNHESALL